jgi:hypothetical protein
VPTLIGVDHKGIADKVRALVPDYMVMGEKGMAEMAEMEMPIPDNTLPMMTGQGPFGAIGMGGMFSVVKVRDDVQPGVYQDPGWYQHPAQAVAYEFTGELATPARAAAPRADSRTLQVRKPGATHSGHEGH